MQPPILEYAPAKPNRDPLWVRIVALVLTTTLATIAICGLGYLACGIALGVALRGGELAAQPGDYSRYTGLPRFTSMKIHDERNLRQWQGDGDYFVSFDLDAADLAKLLEKSPWTGCPWTQGAPPEEIQRNLESLPTAWLQHGLPDWESDHLLHAAEDFKHAPQLPWHNGRVAIVDSKLRRVWVLEWDM